MEEVFSRVGQVKGARWSLPGEDVLNLVRRALTSGGVFHGVDALLGFVGDRGSGVLDILEEKSSLKIENQFKVLLDLLETSKHQKTLNNQAIKLYY